MSNQVRPFTWSAAAAAACLTLSSCSDIPTAHKAGPDTSRQVVTARSLLVRAHPAGVELLFSQMADKVPGFAGFYFDGSDRTGQVIVRLVDMSRAATASAQLMPLLTANRRRVAHIRAMSARFSYRELAAWRDSVFGNLPARTYSIDLDEVGNRVNVGVGDASAIAAVQALAVRAGIPDSALHTFIAPPPSFRQSLTDAVRPLIGGLEIGWTGGTKCTIGVNGEWESSSSYAGFTTASHCSQVYMHLDLIGSETHYWQNADTIPSLARWA